MFGETSKNCRICRQKHAAWTGRQHAAHVCWSSPCKKPRSSANQASDGLSLAVSVEVKVRFSRVSNTAEISVKMDGWVKIRYKLGGFTSKMANTRIPRENVRQVHVWKIT